MFKQSHYIALALAVVLTVVVLNLPERATSRLKLTVGSVFVPLFGLAGSAQQVAHKAEEFTLTRRQLLRENEKLRRQNQEFQLQIARAESIERENARLRQMVAWKQQQPWKLRLGNVVLREPANWWRTVHIDLGSRDGMVQDLPVLTTDGFLVGRISSVSMTRSQVVLLGDPNCRVAARIENEARDTGVISAAGPMDTELVEMRYLSRSALLQPGQNVVTSGLGGVFPKNLPVGKVVDSQQVDYGFQTLARVRLGANLNALEDVWVVMNPN